MPEPGRDATSVALRQAIETDILPALMAAGAFRKSDDPYFGAWTPSIQTHNWTLFLRPAPDQLKRLQLWTGTPTQRALHLDVTTLTADPNLIDGVAAAQADAAQPIGSLPPEAVSLVAYLDRKRVAYHRAQRPVSALKARLWHRPRLRALAAPLFLLAHMASALAWPFTSLLTRRDRDPAEAATHLRARLPRLLKAIT